MRIAIFAIDHNESIALCDELRRDGHHCHAFSNDRELRAHLLHEDCDLLVLELPHGVTAGTFIPGIRDSVIRDMPIFILANRSGEDAIVDSMRAGVADYLVKPIRRSEFVLRVRVLLKLTYPEQHAAERIAFGQYAFEVHTGRATIAGQPIELTQKEFNLALLFFRNLGRPLSRAYIVEAVWPREAEVPSRTMDTHVSRIRNKLALRPENGFRLIPVYSYGYRLEQSAN